MAGNPSNARIRAAFGDAVSRSGSWWPLRFSSEAISGETAEIESNNIRPDGQAEEPALGKISFGSPAISADLLPEDHHILVAAHMGAGATPVEGPVGVYTHLYQPSETDLTIPERVWLEVYRDLGGAADLYRPVGVASMQIGVQTNQAATVQFGLAVPRVDHYGEAVEVAATGVPPLPVVRGLARLDIVQGAGDQELYLTVDSVTATHVILSAKISGAAAYATTFPVAPGEWTEVVDEAGEPVGADEEPVAVYLSGVLADYTAADEWRVPPSRPAWVTALPLNSPLSEVLAQIYVDGVLASVDQITLASTRPMTARPHIGGRFVDEVVERGTRTVVWSVQRDALTRTMQDRILRGGTASIRLTLRGALIGATGVRRSIIARSLNCRLTGGTPTVGGREELTETITLTGYPGDDATYPDALAVEVVDTIADITA